MEKKKILLLGTLGLVMLCITFILVTKTIFAGSGNTADQNRTSKNAQDLKVMQKLGIGALGRIEPRSRVIRLSHDLGMEGARIDKLLVKEGQDVQAGDVVALFTEHDRRNIQVNMAQAKVESLKARAQALQAEFDDATNNYKRTESLKLNENVSEALFDTAKARLQKAKAERAVNIQDIAAAEAEVRYHQQRLAQTKLLAPLTGTVLKIYTRTGESVGIGQVLDIANLVELDVVAEVYENDMSRVKVGQKAEIILSGLDKAFPAEVRELGFFVRKNDMNNTDPLADRDNRIVEVRLTILGDAVASLRHQIYRQVQVKILP